MDGLEQTQRLHFQITGEETLLTSSPEIVRECLETGIQVHYVELPWDDGTHQLVPTRCEGGRLYFKHGLKTAGGAGQVVGGPGQGPRRRLEPNGDESMDLAEFFALFAQGGKALIAT